MSNVLHRLRRPQKGAPMVSAGFAGFKMQGYPHETGCTFHGGVKVRVLCEDALEARQFGELCVARGLKPYQPSGLLTMTLKVMPVVNERREFVRWRGHILLLETQDGLNLGRFVNWLREAFKEERPAPPKSMLTEMADAGEIETFDMG